MDIFPLVVNEAHQARRRLAPHNPNALRGTFFNYSTVDPLVVFDGVHEAAAGRRGAIPHSSTALIDGVWATAGSINLDRPGFLHNHELDATALGAESRSRWSSGRAARSTCASRRGWLECGSNGCEL
jgi:phosphatidylserine/phosphatidylglycerophosphate/cardiolipin synthase-like enzyme